MNLRKRARKIGGFLIGLLWLLGAAVCPSASGAELTVSNSEVAVREAFTLTVQVEADSMYALSYTLKVPGSLEATALPNGVTRQGEAFRVVVATDGAYAATFSFYARQAGTYSIQMTDGCYSDGEVEESLPDAAVSVTVTAPTVGDINGDGVIDTTDLSVLKKRLANLPVTDFREDYADLSRDGAIDTRDLSLLKKWLAGLE